MEFVKEYIQKHHELIYKIDNEKCAFREEQADFYKAKAKFDARIEKLNDKKYSLASKIKERGIEIIRIFMQSTTLVNEVEDLEKFGFICDDIKKVCDSVSIIYENIQYDIFLESVAMDFITFSFIAYNIKQDFLGKGIIRIPTEYFDVDDLKEFALAKEAKVEASEEKQTMENRLKELQQKVEDLQKEIKELENKG